MKEMKNKSLELLTKH